MSESLRDRVARVLCEYMDDDGPKGPVCGACYGQADALVAAGIVAEPQVSRNAHERLAQQQGMSLELRRFEGTLRIHNWTSTDRGRVLVEYRPEAPREAL